ncbi:MAG TPA: hypothetical protein VMR45_06055 [Patescibacteria group bacterium]|nr:hypothetical protein [Patescibacteria group bacterium]
MGAAEHIDPNYDALSAQMQTPEDVVRQLVNIAEADMMAHDANPAHGHPGRHGGKELGGFCRSASHVVEHHAEIPGLDVRVYQTRNMHAYFNGEEGWSGSAGEQAFGHAISVVKVGDAPFLVCLTFGQFCHEATVRQFGDTGIPSSHPLAQRLIEHCFVALDDTTLREFLHLTTASGPVDTSYIENATVEQLLNNAPTLESPWQEGDIESGLMWHEKPCAEQTPPCVRPKPLTAASIGSIASRGSSATTTETNLAVGPMAQVIETVLGTINTMDAVSESAAGLNDAITHSHSELWSALEGTHNARAQAAVTALNSAIAKLQSAQEASKTAAEKLREYGAL